MQNENGLFLKPYSHNFCLDLIIFPLPVEKDFWSEQKGNHSLKGKI